MRALLLWLLMLAQPIYGASSANLRLLGPAHWHAAPAVVAHQDDWLQPAVRLVQRVAKRVQALRAQTHARAHALGARHEHHGLLRHWHEPADEGVRTVAAADPAVADLVAGAAAGSAALVLGAPVRPLLVAAHTANGRWHMPPAPAWVDALHRPTPPPPRS
ncbi:hypothetical protein [Roseateles sp. LYH14W]|uniref:Secreted protein n=1 Tax=Pelomonas parva TaxID=3299032 RepID=A0ABW7F3N4_9BURK